MRSLALLSTAAFLLAPVSRAQDPAPKPADPARIAEVVQDLEGPMWITKGTQDRIDAIRRARDVVDGRVVAAIETCSRDKDPSVQAASVDALGRMPHPEALEALHRRYKADRQTLKDDEKLLPLLLKSIGRHGSERSIEILSDDLFLQRSFPAIQARVLSLGNIRSKKSVEALIGMMTKAGPRQVNDHMNLFRQSLVRLTGEDRGPDSRMWTKWWQDHKKDLVVTKETPKVPEIAERAWNDYWDVAPAKDKRE